MIKCFYYFFKSALRFRSLYILALINISLVAYSQPTIIIGDPSPTITNSGPVSFTITYAGATTIDLKAGDVVLNKTGTADGSVAVNDGATSTPEVIISSITGNGTLSISIDAGTSDDGTDPDVGAGPSATFTVDNNSPTLSIGTPSPSITKSGPVTFTITYSGADNVNLTSGDITLNTSGGATGTISVADGGTNTPDVTISSITGTGTIGISIGAGTASDNAGNSAGSEGPSDTFDADNTAPNVPSAPNLASGSDTGSSSSDNLTRDNTPTFNGNYGEDDVIIKLYDGASLVGSDVVESGNFSIIASTLSSGIHNDLKYTATDPVGNVSANSPSFTMTIDRTKPSVVLNDDHPDDIVRDANNVTITAVFTEANGLDGTPKISIGSVVSNANMSMSSALVWTYDWNVPSGNSGLAAVSISVDDDAGNSNSAATSGSGPTTYTIDNNAPSFVSVNDTGDNSYRPGETITFDVNLGESELTVRGDLSVINSGFDNNQLLNDDGDGTYSFTTGDVDTGGNMLEGTSIAVTFTATDVAGNSSTDNSLNLLLDKTKPSFVSGVIANSAKNELVVTFNDVITLSNDNGFSVGGTSGSINGVSGSGSNTLTFTLTGDVISSDVITLDYNSGSGNATDAVGNDLNSFSSGITNNVKPEFSSALVDNANPNQLVASFSEAISLSSTAGFSISGTDAAISAIFSGDGTSSITFTLSQNVRTSDIILFSYSSGNATGSTGVDLLSFNGESVTNTVDPIPEPLDHVSSFVAAVASTSTINLTWTESVNSQLPENYLIVGRDALSGTFASVVDGTPVADDSNWSNGNFAINVPLGTTSQSITGLISGRNYIFRIYPYTNVLASINFKTSATVPQDNATPNVGATTIISSGSGVDNVSSVIDTKAKALAAAGNFTFTIDDDGASNSMDTAPTLIDGIIIHRDNLIDQTGDWTNAIAGVVLKDNGSGSLNSADNPGSFNITADAITITNIPNGSTSDLGYVADNADKDYSLMVWFHTDIVSTGLEIDNKKLGFSIDDSDITVETVTEPLSSTLATSSASSGNANNVIEVTAAELYWKSVTGISTAQTNFTVVVQATDANKNRDYDQTGLVDMDDTTAPTNGYLESEGHPKDTDEDLVQGQFTRTDMQVHKLGTYVFRAQLSGLADGFTGPHVFVAGDAQSDIIITSFDPTDNINYLLFNESPIDGDGSGDIKVAEFEIRDGGAINDGDDAETALTDIIFSLSNFANIKHVALYDGSSIVESKGAAASLTFEDLTTIAASDGGSAVFSLYVSFNSVVTDNDNFQFQITNVAGAGSTFATANGGGAASPLVGDDNRIEVTASQLDFHSTPLNSVQGVNTTILPAQPKVFANDTNGILDVDFNATAVVTSTASLSNIPTAFSNVSPGILDFPGSVYSSPGNGTISVNAGGLNGLSNTVDVIHTTFTNLDIGGIITDDNNGIEAQLDLPATGVDKAILGFSLSAIQNTLNEPTIVDITITFGNPIGSTLTNFRLQSSSDSKYTLPEVNVSNTTVPGADFVSFQSINVPLTATELYYFVVVDITPTANFTSPAILPKLEVSGVNLTSGSVTANVIGRNYTFKDTSPPEIASGGLTPANGNDNFPQNGTTSISFNEAVDALDSLIHIYSLATDTLVATLKVESKSGDEMTFYFNPNVPLVGSPLDGDTDYYILIPVGDGLTTGFKDKSGNAYAGITSSSQWVFKTSDSVAPFFTEDLTPPTLPASAVNIIDKAFDLRIAIDEPGKIFYIVVDPDITTGTPTVDEIRNASFTGTLNSGNADILRGNQYHYISILDDNDFPTGGSKFRVWATAEDLSNPSPNKMVDGDPTHPGVLSVNGVFTGSPGSGIFIQNAAVDVCIGEPQLVFEPINIIEGSDNGFANGTGQTINFILPTDFVYKTDNVNVVGEGGDISNVSFGFINNTILTITYDIGGTNDRDKLIIGGLEVKALGNVGTSGDIIRLGGTGALSIADGTTLVSLNTTQITPVEFITVPNTFSIGDENVFIPLETPTLNALDKGTRLFSGPGVFGDTLYIAAAGLGTHTITFNYTNEIGCTSEFSLDRNIFDSDNAIAGLNSTYCTDDDPVTILFNGRQNFTLLDLKVRVSDVQPEGIDSVDVFNVDAQGGVAISLDSVSQSPSYEFVPAKFINEANFNRFTNIDASGRWTNDGGLLGELTFTGIYKSTINAAQVDTLEKRVRVYYSPTAEITIGSFDPVGDTLFDKGNISPIITAISSLPLDLEFCEDDPEIQLKGSSTSGFFSISMNVPTSDTTFIVIKDAVNFPGALIDNQDGTGFLIPQNLVDTVFNFGEIEVKFTVINPDGGCGNSVAQTIRIHPKPITQFIVPPLLCEETELIFTDSTGYSAEDLALINLNPSVNNTVVPQTTEWEWGFNDLNSGFDPVADILEVTTHNYKDNPGVYSVNLTSWSEFGCASETTVDLTVGGLPNASFNLSGTSLSEEFKFSSTSDVLMSIGPFNHAIDSVAWDINGDGLFDIGNNDGNPLQHNQDTLLYNYSDSLAIGTYDINFAAVSTTGCSSVISQSIVVLDNINILTDSTYNEDFTNDEGHWVALPGMNGDTLSSISWAWGTPAPEKPSIDVEINQAPNIWVTSLDTAYKSAEQSFVYSPTFDIRNLDLPMIQFDIFKELENQDGVIFEYSIDSFNIMDSRKVWKALGEVDSGIEWFDVVGLAGSPGNDATNIGWTGADTSWVTAKHSLGDIYDGGFTPEKIDSIKSRVIFRIGMGAIASTKTKGGFAFDNVFVGNRTRTVLLENFTSMAGDSENSDQNNLINELASSSVGSELVVLTYHTSFDGEDILNLDNPSEPAARALYYGVSTTPRVVIDGHTGPAGSESSNNRNLVYEEWGDTFYSKRTLQISPFIINLELDRNNVADGKVRIFANLTAKEKIDTSFVVHIAVVEKEILDDQLGIIADSRDTIFYNTLRKMLPNAAGTRFVGSMTKGSQISLSETWNPSNVVIPNPNPTVLQVIVFIQDEVSQEVLQAASINYTNNIVLAIEKELSDNGVALYPNPADRQITFKLAAKTTKETPALIFDNTGKIIEEITLKSGQDMIELNTINYRPGIYLFTLPTEEGAIVKRFAVIHR